MSLHFFENNSPFKSPFCNFDVMLVFIVICMAVFWFLDMWHLIKIFWTRIGEKLLNSENKTYFQTIKLIWADQIWLFPHARHFPVWREYDYTSRDAINHLQQVFDLAPKGVLWILKFDRGAYSRVFFSRGGGLLKRFVLYMAYSKRRVFS